MRQAHSLPRRLLLVPISLVLGFTYHISLYFSSVMYGVVIHLVGLVSKKAQRPFIFKTYPFVLRALLMSAGVKVHTHNREILHQLKEQSYIMVCNHITTIDVPVLIVGLDLEEHDIRYVFSARATKAIPVIGKFVDNVFQQMGWISIKDTDDDSMTLKRVISTSRRHIKEDGYVHVGIFPEGIRTDDGEIKDFQEGAFYLSLMLQLPIVPVLLSGVYSVHKHLSFPVKPGKIGLRVLEPIYPEKVEKDRLREQADELRLQVQEIYESAPDLNVDHRAEPSVLTVQHGDNGDLPAEQLANEPNAEARH